MHLLPNNLVFSLNSFLACQDSHRRCIAIVRPEYILRLSEARVLTEPAVGNSRRELQDREPHSRGTYHIPCILPIVGIDTPFSTFSSRLDICHRPDRERRTMADIPLQVISENSASERRITPSWSISQLKRKLEPVTGVPPSSQRISLKTASQETIAVEAVDEDTTLLSSFPLSAYAELHIVDIRPASAKLNFNDTSNVEKYVMPEEEYEKKSDSVLAWKKAEKLGRFNPDAPSLEKAKIDGFAAEIVSRGIEVGKRCRLGGDDSRRGEVKYVGDVKEIPGAIGAWVGVQLDEPVGKNDGSIGGTRYWGTESALKHGVFVRPERVEVGEYPVLDDLEDMEEI